MKLVKIGLRVWITIASVFSFVVGWIMLVHAPKPYQSFQQDANTALPTLEPLPPLSQFVFGDDNNFQNQPMFNTQPRQRFGSNSFFRTGGS